MFSKSLIDCPKVIANINGRWWVRYWFRWYPFLSIEDAVSAIHCWPSDGYGGMDEPELKIIDVFVCKLRKKLAVAAGGDNYIETVWGRGYVLRDPTGAEAPKPVKIAQAAG